MKMKWCLMLGLSIWVAILEQGRAVDEIALNLASSAGSTYSTFLANIRKNVKDSRIRYGGTNIPVIGAPTNTYLRIDLQLTTDGNNNISLCLKRNDLYVVAYMAKNDKQKYRAYYFSSLITSANLDKVFTEAKGSANQQIITEYQENYASLEKTAKTTRKKAGVGIGNLKKYMRDVNGKARIVQNEAIFMLVAIQIVSEATRFGYLEIMVVKSYPDKFVSPDDKVIILERNWDRVSGAIKSSKKGVFPKPLELKADGASGTWTVKKASDLSMGILKYLGKTMSLSDYIYRYYLATAAF